MRMRMGLQELWRGATSTSVRGLQFRSGWIALGVLVGVLVVGERSAQAWGRLGHRAAGRLAESRLTPGARVQIRALLGPDMTLADASTWADEVRRDRPESAPWHYVNVPLTEVRYEPRFCPPEGCVVSKIEDFRSILADRNRSQKDRREALLFLVHFVQDMHQPVHVGERNDRGGNDLKLVFFGEDTNLHRIWDSGLIDRATHDEDAFLRTLTAEVSPGVAEDWSRGTPADWATESLAMARLAYLQPGTSTLLISGAKLDQSYADFGIPTARRRLAQAGVRLAFLLNEALN